MLIRAGGFALGMLLLASCAPSSGSDCDPTQGGLFQGIRCSGAGGGFDQRVQARKDQEATLLARRAELSRESERLEAERQTVAADLATQQAEQKRAKAELAAVERKLKSGQQQNRALQQQKKALEADVARTKAEVDQLAAVDANKRARLAELQKEQDNLDKEYKAATGG
jgi:chromosome segregation ATPase